MEQFKRNARAILSDSSSTRDMTFVNNVEYRQSDVTDIVTAYKSLKGTLLKAQGGSKQINQVPPNASYLRKTIAVQQQSKTDRIDNELLRYSLEMQRKYTFC